MKGRDKVGSYTRLPRGSDTLASGLAAFQGQAFGLRIDGDVEHPRSIDCALRKLRMNSPATISSSTDIDTWLTRGAGAFGRLFRGGGASRRNRRDLG